LDAKTDLKFGTHPDFENPPVVETVLGIEYSPLEKWRVTHFGLFWETIRTDFPDCEDQLPLLSQIEKFDRPSKPEAPKFEFIKRPDVRCWFKDRSRSVLLQIQNGRFVQNWRKETGTESYPHYENTREDFERDWNRFLGFLKKEELGAPIVQQCEVLYINHLEVGMGWSSLAELGHVFPPLAGLAGGEHLPVPEAFLVDSRYLLPDKRGRLYVQVQPAVRDADGKEILLLNLTARGAPYSSEVADVLAWFDFGREWVHKAFAEFTAPAMHSVWGRRRADS